MNKIKQQLKDVHSINGWIVFAGLSVYYITLSYLWQNKVLTDEVYYNSFGEQVALERIDRHLSIQKKIQWVGYALFPIIITLKVGLVAICLNVGALLSGLKIGFKKLWKTALVADGVFVLAALVRMLWVMYVKDVQTVADAQVFYPLSMLNLFDTENLIRWFIYPLQLVNAFEVFYWCILALGVQLYTQESFKGALKLVLSSYGVGLITWIVLVMFLSVNLS